ncbi:MAG: glycine--tRNA ligase subunit beta [Burkholderiaceae bacterium]|jgi:glycyl-tRNA synthetase beta chain|nr:glycine--tRNA ligase subunit beta [Burkholderiaceae bacterium]
MKTLLVELLTEELPPKALTRLAEAFAGTIEEELKQEGFLSAGSTKTVFATPRRLALTISEVSDTSPDKSIRLKVLPVSIALDAEGNPTIPLRKKLAAMGFPDIGIADMEKAMEGKTENFFYTYTAPGNTLASGLQAALEKAIRNLPIPKMMTYQRPDGETVEFVRPAHGLMALYGQDVIPVAILGLTAGRVTQGHRFMTPGEITIPEAAAYSTVLEGSGHVIAGFQDRKDKIRAVLHDKAQGDQVLMPDMLLDEVTALVEWPVVYECHFEPVFLGVPQECLILTMQTNQKYFALTDTAGRLRSRFLIVSNMETNHPERIISGNERVIRPRLSDARFFFEQDQKKTLEERLPGLTHVVYHNKLGTLAQRMARVRILAVSIANMMQIDTALVERGALLAKADLLTEMVGEFPELQGIMGTYYARHDGEPEEVALAATEHYLPRFAGDKLPGTPTGTAIALADKLEALTGIWGIGLQPTGDRDPFALRRHAFGILRILIEKKLPLSLRAMLFSAVGILAPNASFKDPTSELIPFIMDRLRGLLRDRGHRPDEIEAVLTQNPDRFDNILDRLDAVKAFAALPEAESLAAANKRITNILKKSDVRAGMVQPNLLQETSEQKLYQSMSTIKPDASQMFVQGDYTGTLKVLAQLRDDVDAFFTHVLVMADDQRLRNNRIALLTELHTMMNQVADISKLAA